MRVLFWFFVIAISVRVSLTTQIGASFLGNAFAISHYKGLMTESEPNLLLPGSRQSSTYEDIPLCDSATAQTAVDRFESCGFCYRRLIQVDGGVSPDAIKETCPDGCCGEYDLKTHTTGHFIHCNNGCCSRLVSLQTPQNASPDQLQLAVEFQVIVNNEVTVTGVNDVGRCALNQGSANGCGQRCAYLPNSPGRCDGRSTVNVPKFGQNLDSDNVPCMVPEGQAGNGEESSTNTQVTPGDGGNSLGTPLPENGDCSPTGSPSPIPNPSASAISSPASGSDGIDVDPGVCIDARALRHLRPVDLAFETHALASVLCDPNDTCATPSHMVVFRGQAMMMKTYCGLVECSRCVMHVNSPRFIRRVRIPSNTSGLEFTAFAARYESRSEEALLSLAIRVGL